MNCSGVNNGCVCGSCTTKADAAVKNWLAGDEFSLANENPKPAKKPFGDVPVDRVQKALFTGLDCLPGQSQLFETDGGPQ